MFISAHQNKLDTVRHYSSTGVTCLFSALSATNRGKQKPDLAGFNPQTAAWVTCATINPKSRNKKTFQSMKNVTMTVK